MNRGLITSAAVLCLFLAILSVHGTAQDTAPPSTAQTSAADPTAQAKIQQFMAGDSVFIENAGQWPNFIRFALDSRGANVGITDQGPRFQLFGKRGLSRHRNQGQSRLAPQRSLAWDSPQFLSRD